MFKNTKWKVFIGLSILALLLSACGVNGNNADNTSANTNENADTEDAVEAIEPHQGLNQEPVPLEVERDGKDVYIDMTTQITDIEIAPGLTYKAWTFNGEAPGPLIVVEEGDMLHFEIDNIDPAIPHSIDLHAVHTDQETGFSEVVPKE